MAWRLHEYVLRGEIDNRLRGRVTGRVWLSGVDKPLELTLRGDCHPDLAGCRLTFENPAPIRFTTPPPVPQQRGTTGDITAARKVRVFDLPVAEAYSLLKAGGNPPEHLANSFYLEWFNDSNGRVVIESTGYRLEISEPVWRFTAEELAERARRAADQSGEFITRIESADEAPWDEFRAEQFLRESDATGDRYRRLLEKYIDHPDRERLIAREMGWTWIEEALDAGEAVPADEQGGEEFADDVSGADPPEEPAPDPAREGIDWVRDRDEGFIHPTAKHARDTFHDLRNELEVLAPDLSEKDAAVGEFESQLMILSVKLCAHLNFLVRDDLHDPALLIAWLKRDLEIHNKILAASSTLADHPLIPSARLAYYRSELFKVREAILAIISRLRKDD